MMQNGILKRVGKMGRFFLFAREPCLRSKGRKAMLHGRNNVRETMKWVFRKLAMLIFCNLLSPHMPLGGLNLKRAKKNEHKT